MVWVKVIEDKKNKRNRKRLFSIEAGRRVYLKQVEVRRYLR